MHRRPLLDLLGRHAESALLAEEEKPSLGRLIAFVSEYPDCFERSLLVGHVTGSAWVVDQEERACLLVHHRKLDLWLQPGGHADGDADILRVALREAEEESGISGIVPVSREIFDVDVHAIPARKDVPAHFHHDVRFLLRAPAGAVIVKSEESYDVRWVPMEEVPSLASDASVLRMAQKWKTARAAQAAWRWRGHRPRPGSSSRGRGSSSSGGDSF